MKRYLFRENYVIISSRRFGFKKRYMGGFKPGKEVQKAFF